MSIADIISLGGEALGILKITTEVAKDIKDIAASDKPDRKQLIDSAVETLRDKMAELQDKHLALQQIALTAMEQNLTLAQEKRAMEEKLTKLEQFDAARQLFERVPLALNTSAYREKTFNGPADAQPLLCPNCFESSKKTYLSFHEHADHTKHMKCTTCGTSVHIARNDGPAVMIGSVRSRRDFFDDY